MPDDLNSIQPTPPMMAGVLGGLPLGQPPNVTPTAGEATPMLAPGGGSADMSALVAQLIPQIIQNSQQVQQTASQVPTDNVPLPPRGFGFNPKFQPVTGQGFGGGTRNLLGDILKGAALLGASTKPGRAVEAAYYGPGISKYEAERQQRASQVEALKTKGGLQAQAGSELSTGASAAGLASYRGGMLGIRQEDEQIKQQKADQEGERISNQASQALIREQQGWEKLNQNQQAQKFKQWYQTQLVSVANARITAGESMNDARINAQKDLASALAQNNFVRSNPIIGEFLMNVLGEPTFQQSPGAQTTDVTRPNNKGGARAGAAVPKGTIVYDPQGQPHTSDGTHPLPPQWSLKPPKGRS